MGDVNRDVVAFERTCCFMNWCGMPASVAADLVLSTIGRSSEETFSWAVRKLGPFSRGQRPNEHVARGLVAYVESGECGEVESPDIREWSAKDPRIAVAARQLAALFAANKEAPWPTDSG